MEIRQCISCSVLPRGRGKRLQLPSFLPCPLLHALVSHTQSPPGSLYPSTPLSVTLTCCGSFRLLPSDHRGLLSDAFCLAETAIFHPPGPHSPQILHICMIPSCHLFAESWPTSATIGRQPFLPVPTISNQACGCRTK